MKRIRRIALALVGFLLAFLAGILLLNTVDEALEPGVAQLLNESGSALTDEENGYYALLGMESASGEDIHEVGVRISQAYREAVNTEAVEDFSVETTAGASGTTYQGNGPVRCDYTRESCIPHFVEMENDVLELLSRNALLLERYRSLYGYQHFQQVSTPSPFEPRGGFLPGIVFELHPLVLAGIALRFDGGDAKAALQTLGEDILFWRRMLAETNSFYEKRDAFSYLQSDYALLSEMLRSTPRDSEESPLPARVLEPLTAAEKSFDRIWDHELQSFAWSLDQGRWPLSESDESRMSRLSEFFLSPNATLNDLSHWFSYLKEIARMSPDQFHENRDEFEGKVAELGGLGWKMLYNASGKMIAAVAASSVEYDLLGNGHDLDALIARAAQETPAP